MMKISLARWTLGAFCLLAASFVWTTVAGAHCDTMNGPVVTAAKKALEAGDVNLVLIWVRKDDEKEIREAFQKTMQVRKLSPEAKTLADRYFFETLVRVHRAGEGVGFTGLKESEDVEPGILAADKALEAGTDNGLLQELGEAVRKHVHERFAEVTEHSRYAANNLEAGRAYVHAYVEFIHYVERLHNDLMNTGLGHGAEGKQSEHH